MLRAKFHFNDLRAAAAALPFVPGARRRLARALERLNDGRDGPVVVRVMASQLDPRIVPFFGVDTEITLVQEAPRRRGPDYTAGEVEIPELGCTFSCGGVYVPREMTALCALRIIDELVTLPRRGRTFWDIGCASGLFGIAVKKCFPELRVVCVDISRAALRTTAANARTNGVEVEVKKSNLFSAFAGARCDYLSFFSPQSAGAVAHSEYVIPAVLEPSAALAGGGDGLAVLARFCHELDGRVRSGGTAWLMLGGMRFVDAVNWLSPAFVCRAATERPLRGFLCAFTPRRARHLTRGNLK
jgi:hypothetical protein